MTDQADDHDPWQDVLDRDPERRHADVPLELELLDGQTVLDEDGRPMTVAIHRDALRLGAWYEREAARLLRLHRAGNLDVVARPERRLENVFGTDRVRLGPATVRIRDEEGVTRNEEIRGPAFAMFEKLATEDDDA